MASDFGRFGMGLLILLCLTPIACTNPKRLVIAPSAALDRAEFHQGLAALHEFTPDGYARAIEHFQRASELSPGDCEYRLHLAEANLFLALEQKLNSEDFRPTLERGADPQCAPGSAFSLRLDAFRSLDDFGPSRDRTGLGKIDQAIGIEPENPFNWLVRWKMNPTTRQQENSILKAAEIAPALAVVQYELGNYWLVKADYAQARRAFDRALERSPRHFRSWIGLAQALSAIDENELAREHYLAVLKRNPRFEVAHLRLGLNYLQTIEFDEAERAFQNAIEINPASYEAHYYLGNIWFARGNLEMARGEYEEALKFVLNFPEAVYALGTVFFREGKTDSALEQFEKVLRMNRANADAYFSRAAIRVQHRQFTDAIDDYNRAIGLYDNQLLSIGKSIEQYEDRRLTRKVEAERKRKERLEGIVERARQLKMKAEDESLGPR